MNVIVWVSYGNSRVFAVETDVQLNGLFSRVQDEMRGWELDAALRRVKEDMEHFTKQGRFERAARELVGFVSKHGADHESFSMFELSTLES